MVRYSISESKLRERIAEEKESWLRRSEERTERFRASGRYDESSGMWSEIKAVYMSIQSNKCAFCERELEGETFGKIEHDVEHYRPKKEAAGWPTDTIRRERRIDLEFPGGEPLENGYFLLAYHPLNYVTSCKSCNSPLKGNFFPIAKDRVSGPAHPKDYRSEEPYLFYPLSNIDIDPERAMTFEGIIPVPVNQTGKKRLRAQVTIAFFALDTREILLRQRARSIVDFSRAWQDSIEGRTQRIRDRGDRDVDRMTRVSSPHAACIRAFRSHCESRPDHANRILDLVFDYLDSIETEPST